MSVKIVRQPHMIMKQSYKYYVLRHLLSFASLRSVTTSEFEAIYLPQLPVFNSSPHPYGYGNHEYPRETEAGEIDGCLGERWSQWRETEARE